MRPMSNTVLPVLACFFLCGATLAQIPNAPAPIPSEIVIDQSCRLVTQDLRDPANPRERRHYDSGICVIEGGERISAKWEKNFINGKVKGTTYWIVERTYLLHNPYPQPIVFLVKQKIAKDHRIDSDPQPDEIVNSVALFKVFAAAGETVRLHVGDRDPA